MEIWKDGIKYSEDGKTILAHDGTVGKRVEIPEGTKCVDWFSMQGLDLDCLKVPKSVTRICGKHKTYPPFAGSGKCAFDESHIGTLEFAEGRKRINNDAMYGAKIRQLILPKSLQIIGRNAFRYCGMHDDGGISPMNDGILKLHEGVKDIGECAFQGTGIREVELPSTIEHIGKVALGDDIKLIRIHGDRPINGLIESIVDTLMFVGHIVAIEFRGCPYVFPRVFEPSKFEGFIAKWNAGEFDEEFARQAYKYAYYKEDRQDGALMTIRLNPGDPEIAKIISSKTAKDMLSRYLKDDNTEAAKDIVSVPGLLSANTLRATLDSTENPLVKAYILDALQDSGKGKKFQV